MTPTPRPAVPPPAGIALVDRPERGADRPSDGSAAASGARATRHRLVRAEIRCHLCADLRGVLEVSTDPGDPSPMRLMSPDGSPGARVAWASLRCLRCGSRSLFLDEQETVVRRVEAVDWSLDRPRRGRPPRWLVAARFQRDAA